MGSTLLDGESGKKEAMEISFETYRRIGNLTTEEIRELLHFEFQQGPITVEQQLRRYYLKLKNEYPEKAGEMLKDIDGTSFPADLGIKEIETLCTLLYKYVSGAIITVGGHSYYMTRSNGRAKSIHSEPQLYMDGYPYTFSGVVKDTKEVAQATATPVNFYYMKECHYPRQLGLSPEDSRCFVPAEDASRDAITGLMNEGVNGLVANVNLIVFRLFNEDFSPTFSVQLSLEAGTHFQDLTDAGSIDLSGLTAEEAQECVRRLVNAKLGTL